MVSHASQRANTLPGHFFDVFFPSTWKNTNLCVESLVGMKTCQLLAFHGTWLPTDILYLLLADGKRRERLMKKLFSTCFQREWRADGKSRRRQALTLVWDGDNLLLCSNKIYWRKKKKKKVKTHWDCPCRWHVGTTGALWFPSSLQSGGWVWLVSSAQGGGPASGPGPGDCAVRWVRRQTFSFAWQSEVIMDKKVTLIVLKL